MSDKRRKDVTWNLPTQGFQWQHVEVAVLMDIRDELQKLNALLHCHNTVAIPALLRGIKRNTQPKVRAKAKPKSR